MSDSHRTRVIRWTRERAALLAAVCLMMGIGGGWLIRGPQVQTAAGANAANISTLVAEQGSTAAPTPVPID